MNQESERELPLEVRIEQRATNLGNEIKDAANLMRQEGLSERAIAGHFATVEGLNNFMETSNLKGADKEKLILEFQDEIRTLVHGLTMGDQAQRRKEQLNIANGEGELRKQVEKALRQANKTGMVGGQETVLKREQEV